MAALLVLDEKPGMLNMMLSYGPGGDGVQPKIGSVVEESARKLKEALWTWLLSVGRFSQSRA